MELDRRSVLAAGSAWLGSCSLGRRATPRPVAHDALLAANRDRWPESPGGVGTNHYPMASEALEALGWGDAIPGAWIEGSARYADPLGRAGDADAIGDWRESLGAYDRYRDWLARFRGRLATSPWREVVGRWVPRLAPGLAGAAFHGLIRTGHAVRALRQRETDARRDELAAGLAYWAARYVELPTAPIAHDLRDGLSQTLAKLEHAYPNDLDDVPFHAVTERLTRAPVAPPVGEGGMVGAEPPSDLATLVRATSTAYLEVLVQERHRIWLLHTVTAPASAALLLPELDPSGARAVVAYTRQAVVAMFVAYGGPFTPREHLRSELSPWPTLIERAAASESVHGIKLIEALQRFDRDGDPIYRSVAEQWFEWV